MGKGVFLGMLIFSCFGARVSASETPTADFGVEVSLSDKNTAFVRLSGTLPAEAQSIRLYRTQSGAFVHWSFRDPEWSLYPVLRKTISIAEFKEGVMDSDLAENSTYYFLAKATLADGSSLLSKVSQISTGSSGPVDSVKNVILLVNKERYRMEVISDGVTIKTYPMAFGANPTNRKLFQDKGSTPEGVYSITQLRSQATHYRAVDLNYPNSADRARYDFFRKSNQLPSPLPPIGGNIQIHGKESFAATNPDGVSLNWTEGCLAMRNADIDELFDQGIFRVGLTVGIYGSELRREQILSLLIRNSREEILKFQKILSQLGYAATQDGVLTPRTRLALCQIQQNYRLPMTCDLDILTKQELSKKLN